MSEQYPLGLLCHATIALISLLAITFDQMHLVVFMGFYGNSNFEAHLELANNFFYILH
jgi:hypothetical protein